MDKTPSHDNTLLWELDGTGGEDRFRDLPAPRRLKVDGDGLMARLARARSQATRLAWVGPDNRKVGNWEGMFLSDPSALLAIIAGTALEGKALAGRGPARGVFRLACLMDGWYGHLLACRGDATLSLLHILTGEITDRLSPVLNRLPLVTCDPETHTGHGFHPVWKLASGSSRVCLDRGGRRGTAAMLHLFLNAARMVRERAAALFPDSLETGDHDPAMGLFMTFASLYQRGGDALNQLPARHRDLYYDRVLAMPPRAARAQTLNLCLSSEGDARSIPVDAHTAFMGGKGSLGRDVTAVTEWPVTVHPGQVTRLETLFCERHPLISPEHELGLMSGLRHHGVDLDPIIPEAGVGTLPSRPLFGPSRRPADERSDGDARVGFGVSAPVLALAEGDRTIHLTLNHAPLDRDGEAALFRTLDVLAKSRKEGREGALRILFSDAFVFSITTATGWHGMGETPVAVSLDPEGPRIQVRFQLGREIPAVTSWDPAIHGADGPGQPGIPQIRAVLNPRTPVYLASLLAPFVLREVQIRVAVRGARELILANQLGPLDPNLPFTPFGPLPRRGSYFVVGHRESASKSVEKCRLELIWADLPPGSQGFAEHYRSYGQGLDNGSFTVALAALKDGQWVAEKESNPRRLFATDADRGQAPAPVTELAVSDPRLLTPAPMAEGGFTLASRNGYFRMEISGPETAFGHQVYPELLTRRLMLQAKVKKKEVVELPNPPYTPTISSISMDYQAAETLDPARDKGAGAFFHLLPSGFNRPGVQSPERSVRLFPGLDGEAHLFLGISGGRPRGRISLLFCLKESGADPGNLSGITTDWALLGGNQWQPLGPRAVLRDTTGGFLTSGVVVLDLPELPPSDRVAQTAMPPGLFWLRATASLKNGAPGALQHLLKTGLARCRGIYLNGVPARLEPGDVAPVDGTGFAPRMPLVGIASAVQAGEGFGGREAEGARPRMARVRERLRHKGRAVTPWDMERLLLEREPGLSKVKCFPAMDAGGNPCPGRCVVAVLPENSGASDLPRLSAHRLEAMKHRLEALASGQARLTVINPAYERIQVRCTLTLATPDGDALNRVHAEISHFLSPWETDVGYVPRFGWCVREAEVRAHIAAHPDVLSVTNFSMLHLIRTPRDRYLLRDTALRDAGDSPQPPEMDCRATPEPGPAETRKEIRPHLPWSIAVPAGRHFLEVNATARPISPEKTGIGELEVGRTLIL